MAITEGCCHDGSNSINLGEDRDASGRSNGGDSSNRSNGREGWQQPQPMAVMTTAAPLEGVETKQWQFGNDGGNGRDSNGGEGSDSIDGWAMVMGDVDGQRRRELAR